MQHTYHGQTYRGIPVTPIHSVVDGLSREGLRVYIIAVVVLVAQLGAHFVPPAVGQWLLCLCDTPVPHDAVMQACG